MKLGIVRDLIIVWALLPKTRRSNTCVRNSKCQTVGWIILEKFMNKLEHYLCSLIFFKFLKPFFGRVMARQKSDFYRRIRWTNAGVLILLAATVQRTLQLKTCVTQGRWQGGRNFRAAQIGRRYSVRRGRSLDAGLCGNGRKGNLLSPWIWDEVFVLCCTPILGGVSFTHLVAPLLGH